MALGLGSNVGDSEAILHRAVERLKGLFGLLQVAPLYRTAPISPIPQSDFLNTVAIAQLPPYEPQEVLAHLRMLEQRAGREDDVPQGPRTLDIDLLFYGDLVAPVQGVADDGGDGLVVPHPRLRQRRFVLAPLCDLRPDLRLPPDGAVARDLLAALGSEQRVERVGWSGGRSRSEGRSRGG